MSDKTKQTANAGGKHIISCSLKKPHCTPAKIASYLLSVPMARGLLPMSGSLRYAVDHYYEAVNRVGMNERPSCEIIEDLKYELLDVLPYSLWQRFWFSCYYGC